MNKILSRDLYLNCGHAKTGHYAAIKTKYPTFIPIHELISFVKLSGAINQVASDAPIFFFNRGSVDVLTRIPFFAILTGSCVNMPHVAEGTRFGGPGQKPLPSMNEFTLLTVLWIFA